jgi:hypothetical protein
MGRYALISSPSTGNLVPLNAENIEETYPFGQKINSRHRALP